MRIPRPLVVLILTCPPIFSALSSSAETLPAEKVGRFLIPRAAVPPKIDGTIDPQQWRGALAIGGLAQQNPQGNLLIFRPTTYFLMWDEEAIYLACRTWIMPGLKAGAVGRTPGSTNAFDPGMELSFTPQGANAPQGAGQQSFKFFVNTMGTTGDMARVAVGTLIRTWQPDFRRAWRQTAPGTAPLGGSWWECEMVLSAKDFTLEGPNRAGDTWKMLLAFNHLPGWMQAAVPIATSYYDASGHPTFVLAEADTPAVQVTMDEIPGLKDGRAAVKFAVRNPSAAAVSVDVQAEFQELVPHVDPATKKPAASEPVALLTRQKTLAIAPGQRGEFAVDEPFPRDTEDHVCTASYQVRQGEKELYRYHVFFVRGFGKDGESERKRWTQAPPRKTAYPLVGNFNPVRNNLHLRADTFYLDDADHARSLAYRIVHTDSGRTVLAGMLEEIRYFYFSRLLEIPRLDAGNYEVQSEMTLADGRKLGPVTGKFLKKDEAREFAAWWGNRIGDVHRVLPPFTKLQRRDNAITLLDRRYVLSPLGLPQEVESNGAPVLAAPARIVATIAGQPKILQAAGSPQITEQKDWRIAFSGSGQSEGLRLEAKGWVEQDGLCYVELTYGPAGPPVRLDALRLEWPLRPADAESVMCIGSGGNFSSYSARLLGRMQQGRLWSTLETGRGGSMMAAGSFYPDVWIGNEHRGLLWWADSDRGWVPDDDVPAHEIVRSGGQVLLCNNLIGKPFTLSAPRSVAFSYNASPFKRLPQGWRMAIHSEDGTFDGPHKQRKDPATGKTLAAIQYICPPSLEPGEWSALWAEMKVKADAKVRAEQPFDPARARNKAYSHTSIALMGEGPLTFDRNVFGYFEPEWGPNTYGDVQQNYYLWLLDRSYREGGIRTNYWDILYVRHFDTVPNGMAYELPDGRVQPGFNGWNLRRFLMRQHALQVDCGLAPGGIVAHATNAYPLVTFPWVDAVLNGEWVQLTDASTRDWVDSYDPEYMRRHVDAAGLRHGRKLDALDPLPRP